MSLEIELLRFFRGAMKVEVQQVGDMVRVDVISRQGTYSFPVDAEAIQNHCARMQDLKTRLPVPCD